MSATGQQPDSAARIVPLDLTRFDAAPDAATQALAIDALEQGAVLYFPAMPFVLNDAEKRFLTPDAIDGSAKNISYSLATGALKAAAGSAEDQAIVRGMLDRYARSSRAFIDALLPHYRPTLRQARTSFRPVEISGRTPASWRKDDTRLHVDAFPATPTRGERILRIFTNVNPAGAGRHWRIGEPFETVARRFVPHIRRQWPGEAALLRALKITRSLRTPYDHLMLNLHDTMKADRVYQQSAAQEAFAFPAGSTWMVFTDQASHAAMAGQHCFEQTFHLPVAGMARESRAPLRVLERLTGHALI